MLSWECTCDASFSRMETHEGHIGLFNNNTGTINYHVTQAAPPVTRAPAPRCPPASSNFIGRTQEQELMWNCFFGPNLSNLSASSLLSNERRVFLLIGIGGCGKTQLARKFMKRVYQRFSERKQTHLVFYVDASTPTTLEAWFIAIAKPTGWTSQVRPRCPG